MVNYFSSFSNITNKTLSRYVRHDNYVTDIKTPSCEMVQLIEYIDRCDYVTKTKECHEEVFVIDYSNFYYCLMAPERTYAVVLSILVLFLMCLLLFLILGTASDGYFCPALKVLSKLLRLSENLAGVTLLAMGNAAPDLFTSIAGLQAEAREAFNDVLGGIVLIQFLVTSAIMFSQAFKLTPFSFLRDSLFLILDLAFMDYVVKSGNAVTLVESLLIFGLYLVYVLVIILDQYFLLRAAKNLRMKSMYFGNVDANRLKTLQSEAHFEILSRSMHRPTTIYETGFRARSMSTSNEGLFKQFFNTIFVLDLNKFREAKLLLRAWMIFRFPIAFILTILIPVVDYEEDLNGWSKLLNTLQVIYLPVVIVQGFVQGNVEILGFPLSIWFFVITVPLAIVLFIFSRTDRAPPFHKYLSILGAAGSVFIVYACATELIEILKVIGYITFRSNSFLGCTLLACGNSVGDLIANTAMARHGYQKMGFAACYGGPLFNSLFTVGMIFIYRAATSPGLSFETGEGTLGENSVIFLLIAMCVFLLGTLTTNFQLRRTLAIFPLSMYILYITYCCLSEFEIIHPYGSDHRMDQKAEPVDF